VSLAAYVRGSVTVISDLLVLVWCEAGRGEVEGLGRGRTWQIGLDHCYLFCGLKTYLYLSFCLSFTLYVCFSTHCIAQSKYVQGVALERDSC